MSENGAKVEYSPSWYLYLQLNLASCLSKIASPVEPILKTCQSKVTTSKFVIIISTSKVLGGKVPLAPCPLLVWPLKSSKTFTFISKSEGKEPGEFASLKSNISPTEIWPVLLKTTPWIIWISPTIAGWFVVVFSKEPIKLPVKSTAAFIFKTTCSLGAFLITVMCSFLISILFMI